MENDKKAAVWAAIGSLTFAETLELAEVFREAWESTHEFEATDQGDWAFLLNTAREIAEDQTDFKETPDAP